MLRQLDHLGRPVPQEYLATEHIVFFVRASLAQVRQLIEAVDCVYEFDLALPAVRDWLTLETEPDQPPPSLRLEPPSGDSPTVALLDTGIASQHPLIAGALLSATSVDPFDNSAEDVFGHGSNMAGPALYSDLGRALDLGEYKATHWIQSVKLFRRPNEGSASAASQAYWPSQTERAVEAAEASSDGQPCAFVLAVTSEVNDMQPTFWSHAVDRLCYNDGNGRLLLVSAGNADATRVDLVTAYPELHKDERIQEPAQSGNALTVGAFTDRTVIPPDKDLEWFAPVAPRGGVSPYTTAGAIGGAPIKPEIVFEGGNLAFDGVLPSAIPTLGALTTGHEPAQHPLTWFWGTSEATARCSYLAAQIWAQTPDLRAESVRALIVHSASWTPAMTSQLPNLDERLALCGYGVPDSEFARSCATERATVLVEDAMPNALEESVPRKVPPKLSTTPATQIAYRRIAKFFSLPIPDRLHELDDQEIELRVTLSYFPEPNIERRRGYNGLDLKWDMQGPNESEVEFRQRINRLARTAGKKATWSGSFPWEVGIERRSRGTVQSDRWRGLASLLEESCAPGFPWTLDCERVLAGGVSKWGSQIKVRRRRREPGGRPEMLPGTAVGDGFRPGASARRCCVCCAARILSPCRGSWGSRRRGPRSGGISSGRRPGQPEEPGAGRPGRGQSSAASQDR